MPCVLGILSTLPAKAPKKVVSSFSISMLNKVAGRDGVCAITNKPITNDSKDFFGAHIFQQSLGEVCGYIFILGFVALLYMLKPGTRACAGKISTRD